MDNERKKGLCKGSCDRLKSFVSGLCGGIRDEYKMLRQTGAIPDSKHYDPAPYQPKVFT